MSHSLPSFVFPDPALSTDPDGLIAVGGDLRVQTLREAYRQGIFPWPHQGVPFHLWFSPPQRALLDFGELYVPRRLARTARSTPFRFTIDADFPAVIAACKGARRPGQRGTWITVEMERAYCRLHQAGDAHSVEAWDAAGKLVGGLYGVDSGVVFSGESMFHRVSDASKLALLFLVDHLTVRGATFLDIQQLTPHLQALGAREVARSEFLERCAAARAAGFRLFGEQGFSAHDAELSPVARGR